MKGNLLRECKGMGKGGMLRPASAHPCAPAQQPAEEAEKAEER